jgi:uncharacterized protein (DUF433 family)
MPSDFQLIGAGVYSLSEAEKITGIPRARIRRWLEGYSYVDRGRKRHSAATVPSMIGRKYGELGLTFADLIEIRFLDRFVEHGVSWPAIRIAAQRARELLGRERPFSSRVFSTDGHTILAEIVRPKEDPALLDLVKNQWEFRKIVSPFLYASLDFGVDDDPIRWWPMGKSKIVVIDPARSFGTPIASDVGVPTEIIALAVAADQTMRFVAGIYDMPLRSVRHAVAYERSLAAA